MLEFYTLYPPYIVFLYSIAFYYILLYFAILEKSNSKRNLLFYSILFHFFISFYIFLIVDKSLTMSTIFPIKPFH
nr:MAG TPA: hypothetical protein [Caudoviricetes sp.]